MTPHMENVAPTGVTNSFNSSDTLPTVSGKSFGDAPEPASPANTTWTVNMANVKALITPTFELFCTMIAIDLSGF